MTGSRRVLVLAPHTDDETIGCGGTIAWHDQQGDWVNVIAFSATEDTKDEFPKALDVLGVEGDIFRFPIRHFPWHRQKILQVLCDLDPPDVVYCPASWDCHQDHQVVHTEAIRAFRDATILGYEIVHNTVASSHPTCYTMLRRRHINIKARALNCYASQSDRRSSRWNAVPNLAQLRGLQCGSPYAEAFEVIRWIR